MSRIEIYEKLNEVFCEQFDDGTIVLTDETVAADVDGWDSLEHVDLMVTVEEAFGIKFTVGEISHMGNVGDLVDLILKKVQ